MSNSSLHKAKNAKNDEWYTLREDVEGILKVYGDKFKDKIVYCNCDTRDSNFYKVLRGRAFKDYGLKKLIVTGLDNKKIEYDGVTETECDIDGSFYSDDCLKILDGVDIVFTNIPFSKSREWFEYVVSKKKDMLFIINFNNLMVSYSQDYIKNGFLKVYKSVSKFVCPSRQYGYKLVNNEKIVSLGVAVWATTFDVIRPPQKLKKFEGAWECFDGTNIINVDKAKDIPDYDGEMGVPSSYLDKICYNQFEIVGFAGIGSNDFCKSIINGKVKYKRLIIKKK